METEINMKTVNYWNFNEESLRVDLISKLFRFSEGFNVLLKGKINKIEMIDKWPTLVPGNLQQKNDAQYLEQKVSTLF